MAQFTPRQYAKALFEALEESPAEKKEHIVTDFARMIVLDGARKKLPEIIRIWDDISKEKGKSFDVSLTTREKLTEKEEKMWKEKIQKLLGGELRFSAHADESLIGGVIIKLNDMVYDASLKSQVHALAEHLRK